MSWMQLLHSTHSHTHTHTHKYTMPWNAQCVPKSETCIILNILYSCCLLQWNLTRYNMMSLAIKCIHNLPPNLSYVSTLTDITHKPKHGIDEMQQRLTDTWNRIPQGIIDEVGGKHGWLNACVKATGHDFKHLLWSSHITGSSLLLFSSMRSRQQLSCPVLRPPSGPNARPQDNMHLT